MLGFTTRSAPPDAVPATTRIPPLVFWYALIAGFGPTNDASMAPASSAVVACVPELNVFSSSLTFGPSLAANEPLCAPMIAGACVTFGKYPSRSVDADGAAAAPDAPAALVAAEHGQNRELRQRVVGAPRVHADQNVFQRGQVLEQPDVLEGARDAQGCDAVGREAGQLVRLQPCMARLKRHVTGDHVDQLGPIRPWMEPCSTSSDTPSTA